MAAFELRKAVRTAIPPDFGTWTTPRVPSVVVRAVSMLNASSLSGHRARTRRDDASADEDAHGGPFAFRRW